MMRYTTTKKSSEAKRTEKLLSQISTYLFENEVNKSTKEKLQETHEALCNDLEKMN